MKKQGFMILQIICYVLTLAAVFGCGYILYNGVMNSNMPDWLKWMLLRG